MPAAQADEIRIPSRNPPALPSVIYVVSNAVVGEITPAAQRGALLAIGTAVSTSAGLLAPYVMGSLIEKAATPLDGFNTGFIICGVIMLVSGAPPQWR